MDFILTMRFDRFNSANLGTESIPVGNMVEKKENGGFGDSGLTSQDILDALRPDIEIPADIAETALSLNLTAETPIYDINNALVVAGIPENVPTDIKVVNTYLGGKIRLYKLTDSTANVNVTVYFDATSTKNITIELYDETELLISSTSHKSGSAAALFYDKDTDLWTVTPITSVSLSEIYKYNAVSQGAIISPIKSLYAYAYGITLFGSYIAGQLNFFVNTIFKKISHQVQNVNTSEPSYTLTDANNDYIILNIYTLLTANFNFSLNNTISTSGTTTIVLKNNSAYSCNVTINKPTGNIVPSASIANLTTVSISINSYFLLRITTVGNYTIIQ